MRRPRTAARNDGDREFGRCSFSNRILRPINRLRYTRQTSCIDRASTLPPAAVAPSDCEKLCEEGGFEVIWDKLSQGGSATAATLCRPERRGESMSKTDYYSEAAHGPHEIFELGNYLVERGITLPNAR